MNAEPSRAAPVLPKLRWYQLVWVGLPLLLMVTGGAIGGVCGLAAFVTNRKVFYATEQLPILRYVYTGAISLAAVAATFVMVAIFVSVVHH